MYLYTHAYMNIFKNRWRFLPSDKKPWENHVQKERLKTISVSY